jgi:hypothetical protein
MELGLCSNSGSRRDEQSLLPMLIAIGFTNVALDSSPSPTNSLSVQ